jgi:nicotinate-nucleotide adenylyltransferase
MMTRTQMPSSGAAMRIGIFGGTFDPIHWGHLLLAEQCREQLSLDEVWFVPAGVPPHKLAAARTSGAHRRQMVEFAIAGHEQFRVCDLELQRPGPSFTVDTLRELHRRHPEHDWWLLIGADSLRDFPTWREPEQIVQLARIAAVNRGDQPPPDTAAFVSQFGDRLCVVTMPGVNLSASDLRRRVRSGRSIRFQTPRAVEVYIQQQHLYSEP